MLSGPRPARRRAAPAGRALGDGRLLDTSGRVRVRWPAPIWEAFLALALALALDEIIVYGAGALQVSRGLQALLEDLVVSVPGVRLPPVESRLGILSQAVRRAYSDQSLAAGVTAPDRQGIGSPRQANG